MRVHDYRDATLLLLREGREPEHVLQGLRDTLGRHGHLKLYPKILRQLCDELRDTEALATASITLAKESDATTMESDITKALTLLNTPSYVIRIDPTITGGFIAETREKRIDQSYKSILLNMYRSLLAS